VSFWILIQVIFDFIALAGVVAVWVKLSRPAKDDPRLSRGLQLLQTKISVLEDLSDRTETQVSQLTALMEHKVKEIQQQILNADKQIQKVEVSIGKSMEVSKIFQDRIPHQEIVERKNTIKYVKAARMAHQGASVDEICQHVDLSRGEIEFIAKVNKNQLQFSEEDLPEWVRQEAQFNMDMPEQTSEVHYEQAEIAPQMLVKTDDRISLSDLGDRFRQAISTPATAPAQAPASTVAPAPVFIPSAKPANEAMMVEGQNKKGETIQVRKVVFRRVDPNSNPS